MILISPHEDSEHCASWFYYVKDKILLGYVAAKAHFSLIMLKEVCVFASCLWQSSFCLLLYPYF